ncbi:MAG: MarR family transcriptional regulator [Acidimicrobiales bacterium]
MSADLSPTETVEALLRASRRLVAVAARSIASVEDEVSVVQFRALVTLWEHSPRTLASFATELAVHPSSATRLCDRLVAKGLMNRSPSPDSRREVELTLTDDGRALVQRAVDRRRHDLMTVARRLSPDERSCVVAAFEIFDRAARSIADDDPTVPWPR